MHHGIPEIPTHLVTGNIAWLTDFAKLPDPCVFLLNSCPPRATFDNTAHVPFPTVSQGQTWQPPFLAFQRIHCCSSHCTLYPPSNDVPKIRTRVFELFYFEILRAELPRKFCPRAERKILYLNFLV